MFRSDVTEEERERVGVAITTELAREDPGWSVEGNGGRFQPKRDVKAAVTDGSSWSIAASEADDDGGGLSGSTD